MSFYGSVLQQGSFTAMPVGASGLGAIPTMGSPVIIQVPAGIDWLLVKNYSKAGANGNSGTNFNGTANAFIGVNFYWQRGMAPGTGVVMYKSNGASTLNEDTLVSGGFTLYDPSGQTAGAQPIISAPVATTASTNATRPVVSTANTAGLIAGCSVVRMSNTAQTDVNGIDMVVGAVTNNVSFTLLTATNALATAPGAIGGAGFYRIVNVDPLFYPRRRFVVNITQAVNAQVSTSVPHQYVPGQAVRFNIPTVSGMIQLNPTSANNYLEANIVSVVDTFNFTIDVDTTAFTAFTWPTIAQQPSSFPEVTPIGEDTALSLITPASQVPVDCNGNVINAVQSGLLSDATVNTGFLGMILGSGGNGLALTTPILGPAGGGTTSNAGVVSAPDTVYWLAGKSAFGGL